MDADTRRGIPCRITIVDRTNKLAAFSALPGQQLAVRPGAVYTPDGQAKVRVSPGQYTLYATRGFEYSLAVREVEITGGATQQIKLHLRHEVPTRNLVSCDTHIHTFTHSRHGDATLEERMMTLAGEGIELPVATEHNLLADYTQAAERVGVQSYFTPVTGVEVTTKKGHFNVFPVQLGSAVPDASLEEWPQLMRAIRSTPGVQVVILNHPRDLHSNFRPFDPANFNAVTGQNLRGAEFSFNAMEVVNSGALQSDYMRLYQDWFALLNYGYRITAVGASDSHNVSDYIVGQSRTYIVSHDDDPARIDVAAACQNLQAGRVFVSMGLLTQMKVEGKFSVGDLAIKVWKQIHVEVVVAGPSWVSADRVELFANGVKIREQRVASHSGGVEKARIKWIIPKPRHDLHLVAIATGPGTTEPYWPIHPPYQPTSSVWQPRVIGATNPIWVDADGDGDYSSPRRYAQDLVRRFGTDPTRLLPALAPYDEAIAAQAAGICQAAGRDVRGAAFAGLLKLAAKPVRNGFRAFIATLPLKQADVR